MLKERQKSLYNLLNSDTSKWFSQKEICDAISDYKYNDRKNSSDKCSAILQDKMTINESQEYEKIIVSKINILLSKYLFQQTLLMRTE